MKFRLSCAVTVSACTEVEADSLAEAIAIAESREVVLGGLHSGADETEQWIIEDADGDPTGIHGNEQ